MPRRIEVEEGILILQPVLRYQIMERESSSHRGDPHIRNNSNVPLLWGRRESVTLAARHRNLFL